MSKPLQTSRVTRRRFLQLSAAGAGMAALAACAPVATPSGTGDAPAAAAAELSFLGQGADDTAMQRYDPLVAQFQEANGDVSINVIYEPGGAIEIQQKLLTLIAAGEAPDVYWAHSYTNAGQAKRNVQLDLTAYIDGDDDINADQFLPAAWNDFNINGAQIGFPRETTSTVIIYNKDMFNEAGVPLPADDWNWEDFLGAATALTSGEGTDKIFGTADWNLNRNTWIRLWQNGGDVLSDDRTTYTMNDADNVAVVEEIASWHQDQGIHIQGEEKGGFGTAELFVAGRVAMFPQFSVFYNVAPAEFEWDVAHLPVNADQTRTTRVASAGHSVYSGTEMPDEAWGWIKFLASETAFWHWADGGLRLPSLKAVATDPKLNDPSLPTSAEHGQFIIDAFDYGRPEPVAGDWIGVHREVQPALDSIYGIEAANAQQALDAIADRVNELVAIVPEV